MNGMVIILEGFSPRNILLSSLCWLVFVLLLKDFRL